MKKGFCYHNAYDYILADIRASLTDNFPLIIEIQC